MYAPNINAWTNVAMDEYVTSMLRKLMGKCCCVVSDKSQFKIEMYEKNGENI